MDSRLAKWIRWFAVIHDDVQQLLICQNIFWEIQSIIKNNKKIHKSSSFYQYLADTYISHVTIGIRRQLKINQTSISFTRLLTEIGEHPLSLNRAYFKGLYKGSVVEDLADKDFDKYSEKGKHISVPMVREDLEKLKSVAHKVEDFVDKRVAHHDKRTPRQLPKFHEVDSCLELMDKLYVKYHLIFHAGSMDTLMPTYQYDWKEIFFVPWIEAVEEDEETNEI